MTALQLQVHEDHRGEASSTLGDNLVGLEAPVVPPSSAQRALSHAGGMPSTPLRVYARRRTTASSGPVSQLQLTPVQQSFIEQVSKMVGTVLPTPRVNKRRPKGPPSGFKPRRSRRVAGLTPELLQLGSARSKKTVMRTLGFDVGREQLNQDDLEHYSKLFSQPLSPS
jgi:hypothetical protein